MQGRHPDFTTSRLFVEATDEESGCKWTLHALREKTIVGTITFTWNGSTGNLRCTTTDEDDQHGYITEALTSILSYLARTLLLTHVYGEAGSNTVWRRNGFQWQADRYERELHH
ncbi:MULTISPECIES: GNAT family N-acetyltransferase [Exiguobacterium]|uniref:GNAT family N-acetyltransferase n=1 Tax=Exiguobacterium sp. UBA1053 TaxID=1946487 RepID=UPI0025B8AAC8|nr:MULTISPECIES: GNAT family N-acetyltransferase [Exiguobacterium]